MTEAPNTKDPASALIELAAELAAAGFENARQVGRGGAGVVFRCFETALGRNVAIKVLPSHFDDESRERFLREGYAMGGLSGHPNILNILRVGITPSGRPYIVMPYCAEDSLAVRLRREGPIPWPEAMRIGVKLCGALETAHRTGILHRDIKPANVLVSDYGEPQLADFGIARIQGGYETTSGFFSGTIDYTPPETLAGNPATVASDIYSLGATVYTLIAGSAAYERQTSEDLVAQYLRISTTPIPDLRPLGIPDAVCSAVEAAMLLDPAERPMSAAELGREFQAAQRSNGLQPDAMAITDSGRHSVRAAAAEISQLAGLTAGGPGAGEAPSTAPDTRVRHPAPAPATSAPSESAIQREFSEAASVLRAIHDEVQSDDAEPDAEPSAPPTSAPAGPPGVKPPLRARATAWFGQPGRKRVRIGLPAGSAVLVAALVAGIVVVTLPPTTAKHPTTVGAAQPAPAATQWRPITEARVARYAVASAKVDGTIWLFGGIRSDGTVTARDEGYDPAVDEWKRSDDLPVAVSHAMAVTWQGNAVVLGGWMSEGGKNVAADQVWRVVNGHWVELPHLLQPRAAAAAAVLGDRIVVTGGVDANGALLNTTEVFDGNSWTPGAPIPTPRQMLAAASDGKLVYAVGGTNGSDLPTVEAYDPAAKTWMSLPALPKARSDLGATIADGRLVILGGVSSGQVLKSASTYDLMTKTWTGLPDMATARHGMAVAVVQQSVYAIGGSTTVDDIDVVTSAEVLKLPSRRTQPASQWRSLPDAPAPRLMMASAVLQDKIWILGGLRDGAALNTVESYEPRAGVWQPGPALPMPLHHAAAATYRGEVVVLGGTSDNIADGSNKVFALRGANWVELPSLGHARAAPAAAVVGDKLVVVGGQNAKQLVPQTEVFDGTSWQDAADMPTPREHLTAVSDGSYVYAIGGRSLSSDRNSAALERFDPASGAWATLVSMPTPRGSYGAAYIDGRIVALGGEEPATVLNVAEMYDIAAGKWSTLPPMPTPRHGAVVATVGNTVYCIGGANRPTHEGPVVTVEALDFS
ncbi:Kelch repeat-containing protein [Mycobacterium shigaense]|uniref:Kelch repeat-containing protein n=1 Tax=Mycobacterium shigaense TaxID=722731 RepID=UPI002ADFD7FE|nr:kelch repeat-containing protein [Mycobacterium shigaense]MEA1122720.1 kelch repeat-containing protein [Mycobacterium shigaense]